MGIPIYQIDAFAARPFEGNPAGVCIMEGPAEAGWMQSVAAEMNLSETAFIYPLPDGWNLRWFTPKMEVRLCGHATLASAHILWESGRGDLNQQVKFHTLSGLLTCARRDKWIEMDFPSDSCRDADPPPGLMEALGAAPLAVFRVDGAIGGTWLVELADEKTVAELKVDFIKLNKVCGSAIVTSRATTSRFDFVSRFFAPCAGIDEDPVTGSAHCSLGPYWGGKLGKNELVGRQVSSRGGTVKVRLAGQRVKISGQAVTVLQGELVR